MNSLFQNTLSPLSQFFVEFNGLDFKVCPEEAIELTFYLSTATEHMRFLREYRDFIPDSFQLYQTLQSNLESNYYDEVFDETAIDDFGNVSPMRFLHSKCLTAQEYWVKKGHDALCVPKIDVHKLAPFFKEYQVYKLYEQYAPTFPNGWNTFLKRIPELREKIETAKINDKFCWNSRGGKNLLKKARAEQRKEAAWQDLLDQRLDTKYNCRGIPRLKSLATDDLPF